ncbi:unnamed protein product [Heligmosomoides polygyrus]|uniref:SET domain-containing protein n=1 Tax=Heligmosomoides polygyrus TaxID=6339 RepID=A0A183FXN0_HELPZ|nr:unnamed protein product [Heligmosomoides polygyrus]
MHKKVRVGSERVNGINVEIPIGTIIARKGEEKAFEMYVHSPYPTTSAPMVMVPMPSAPVPLACSTCVDDYAAGDAATDESNRRETANGQRQGRKKQAKVVSFS